MAYGQTWFRLRVLRIRRPTGKRPQRIAPICFDFEKTPSGPRGPL
jgi:hypothetical protein